MNRPLAKPLFKHPDVVVAPCQFGYGVFAASDIPADTIVEECHHLRIKAENCSGILDDYVYAMDESPAETHEKSETYSLPLGCGSIFNHSDDHNIEYWHDTERDVIVFYTIKNVAAGQQLFINYGRPWWETRETAPDNS